ncbi:peptide chain release factor N(5)-glutamine methyltransferase [Bombiscardovia apis]|nr:peptide chain release factor N(5)-glutamine methyltransferase [Bombiscardovia apis]
MPVRQALALASGVLAHAGIDTPDNDARLLLAEACQVDLHELSRAVLMGESFAQLAALGRFSGESSESALEAELAEQVALTSFRQFVERRAEREPLQYIVGHAPFRFMSLAVGPGVFIPRPETESVVQDGLDWLAAEGVERPLVVDLCAGSGAIGLSVATEVKGAQVWAVELSAEAAVWTRRNLERYRDVIAAAGSSYQLIEADATAPETLRDLDGKVDLVITNPPYVPESQVPTQPEVVEHDPSLALYGGSADGLAIPSRIITRVAALLRPAGHLVLEHDPSQSQALQVAARAAGFATATTSQDLTARDRYLVASR